MPDLWIKDIPRQSPTRGAAKSGSLDIKNLRAYMVSDSFRLDGSKGAPLNFRDWSGQLRMPLALATSEAVIAIAPMDGFEHQRNTLDTLGSDQPEFQCH